MYHIRTGGDAAGKCRSLISIDLYFGIELADVTLNIYYETKKYPAVGNPCILLFYDAPGWREGECDCTKANNRYYH